MWRMALILVLTALAIFFMGRALEAPSTRLGAAIEQLMAPAPLSPPLMYAGVRV